jgi:hypothetical protein
MRGKLAGSVFRRGRYGNFIRTLTSPINTSTPLQVAVRSLFSKVITGWYNLTNDQRDAWNRRAGMAPKLVSFGETSTYNGRALFIHLNRNLQEISEALIANPPELAPVETFDDFEVSIVTTPGSEDITLTILPAINADTKVIVQATPALTPGITYVNPNWYRKIAVLDNTFVSGGSIMTEYLSIFKEMPKTGERVGFRMKAVARISGKDEYPMPYVATATV